MTDTKTSDADGDESSDGEESVASVESEHIVRAVKKGAVPNDTFLPPHVSNAVRSWRSWLLYARVASLSSWV